VTPRTALVRVATCLLIEGALITTNPPVATPQAAAIQSTSPIRGFEDALTMIRDLLDRGRGIEAENIARALLARVESTRGRDVLEVAEVLDLLGRAVRKSARVTEGEKREFAERAVSIKENVLGPWHPDLAVSLVSLAVHRTLALDPAGGRPLLERALAIREKAFGPDHVLVAATLQSLAGLLMTVRDDAGARTLLERALRIREAKQGTEHPETIQTLFKVAVFLNEINDYTGARQGYERVRLLAEKTLGSSHPFNFEVLVRLAVVLSEGFGDYAGAARLNAQLLARSEQTFGPDDPRLTLPLGNLAMDLRELGDYAEAKALSERSLAIAERAYGPEHPDVADSLHTLATVVAAQGDYGEAMRLFERATRIKQVALRPPDPEVSRAGWFIPDLFPLSGYGSEDVILFERAVAIGEQNSGLADPRTAESLSNLAAVLSSVQDYNRTRPLFERVLASQENALGPDHPEVAVAASNLALVLSQTGDSVAARALYERAVRILEKSLGPDHPKLTAPLLNLARLHSTARRDDQAKPLVQRALMIQQQRLGGDHPDTAATLTRLAEISARAGAMGEAFELAARAEEIRREHVRLTARTLSERQALGYASAEASALDVMLSVASQHPGVSPMTTAAWEGVIRARAIVLDEMIARRHVASATDDAETARAATELGSARQRLAAAVVRGIRDDPPERYRRLLDGARSDKERAERDLAERSARFRDDRSRSRVGVRELSAALPDESALIGFVRYRRQHFEPTGAIAAGGVDAEPSYVAFVLRSGETVAAIVPLGSAATIDAMVSHWRQQFEREALAAGRGARRGEVAYRLAARELSQRIWEPLQPHLSQTTRVFVVGDGPLHLVSFAALPTAGSQYLVETGPLVHYLSAERDLVPQDAGPAGAGLLALGGPAFDESSPALTTSPTAFRGTRSTCGDFQSMRFDPLPASLKEVDQVVMLWNEGQGRNSGPGLLNPASAGADTLRLTGTAADEPAFKAKAPGRKVLHLATHGFFLGGRCGSTLDAGEASAPAAEVARTARENPLLLSGLILAGANQRSVAPPDSEDGVLTAEEVAALNLSGVEWAVLSGCDTGAGELMAGEGVFGLRRAFQLAGARTVIMSLWPVEDQATRQWMTTLYRGRFFEKLSTADAVREAGLRMLRQRRAKGLSTHPFHWAAFVAAGDWR
jgi:CHAT domain-containing protein/tetratricopeptide (TPR) repeat protein